MRKHIITDTETMKIQGYFIWAFLPSTLLLIGVLIWYITKFADIVLMCSLIMTFFSSLSSIGALLRRQLIAAGFRLIPLASLLIIMVTGRTQVSFPGLGFYANTLLQPASIGGCDQASGIPHRNQERIALCNIVPRLLSNESAYIIYDSFNELSLPYEARDKNWKVAVRRLPNGRIIADFPHPTTKLFDSFYAVIIPLQDADRS